MLVQKIQVQVRSRSRGSGPGLDLNLDLIICETLWIGDTQNNGPFCWILFGGVFSNRSNIRSKDFFQFWFFWSCSTRRKKTVLYWYTIPVPTSSYSTWKVQDTWNVWFLVYRILLYTLVKGLIKVSDKKTIDEFSCTKKAKEKEERLQRRQKARAERTQKLKHQGTGTERISPDKGSAGQYTSSSLSSPHVSLCWGGQSLSSKLSCLMLLKKA